MVRHGQVLAAVVGFAGALIGGAADAQAQWYLAGYLGATHTQAATVSIDRPADDVSLEYHDVRFEGRSWKSPQYYGIRFGRTLGATHRFGIEIEWMHA